MSIVALDIGIIGIKSYERTHLHIYPVLYLKCSWPIQD